MAPKPVYHPPHNAVVFRATTWYAETGETVQLAVAVLDDAWEPLTEFWSHVGPFETEVEVAERLDGRVRAWVETYGVAMTLFE